MTNSVLGLNFLMKKGAKPIKNKSKLWKDHYF
jgi:hypothetical protein